jgi:RNA polymerase sigma factor for flagellar operon FliA
MTMLRKQQEQVAQYLPFVEKVARRIARRLPAGIQAEELMGAGAIGLVEALQRYKPEGGRSFETYAEFRIKGAILDSLRAADPLSRTSRALRKRVVQTRHALTAELGRPPNDEELSRALDVSMETLAGELTQLEAHHSVPFEDMSEADAESLPGAPLDQEQQLARAQRIAAVRAALGDLPEREQTVLSLYYIDELNQQQIGEVLGVTESRICQILGSARRQLREVLAPYKE